MMVYPWPLNYVFGNPSSSAEVNDDISMNVDMEHDGGDGTMHFLLRSVPHRIMDSISSLPDLLQLFLITIVFVASLYLYDQPSLHVHSVSSVNFVIFRVLAFFGILLALYLFVKLLPIFPTTAAVKSYSIPTQTEVMDMETIPPLPSAVPAHQHLYPYNQLQQTIAASFPPNVALSAPPILISAAPFQPSFVPSSVVEQQRLQLPVLGAPSPAFTTPPTSFNIGKLEVDAEEERHEAGEKACQPPMLFERYKRDAVSTSVANYGCLNGISVKIELVTDESDDANYANQQQQLRLLRAKWTRRTTSNKQRAVVMLKQREAREANRAWLMNLTAKKKNDRKKQSFRPQVSRRRTRVDTNNETKKKIVQCYLRRKKRDQRFSARACKQHFETTQHIKCGRDSNINRWSKDLKVIEYNIRVYGAQKYRNRPRKGLFAGMEEKLKRVIKQKRSGKVNDEWIRAKALQIQTQLYPEKSFKASPGWLRNFKQRHLYS